MSFSLIEAEKPPRNVATAKDVDELREILVSIVKTSNQPKKIRDFFAEFVTGIFIDDKAVRIEYNPQRIIREPSKMVPGTTVWLPGPGSNQGPND